MRIVGLCGALAACACSSDATNPGGTAGAPGAAGAGATAGASAMGGSGGMPGSAGTPGAGAPSGGAPSAGAGGAAAGAAGTGTAGSAGSSGSSAGGAGGSAGGGTAGTSGGGGSGGGMSCAGKAVSFNANTAGGNDAAQARVEIDFAGSTDLPTGNDMRTVEFWAYVLSSSWSGDTNTMFFYGTSHAMGDGFGLDFGGTKGTFDPFTNQLFDNDNQATGLDSSKDQWVHFAMTWDGTTVRAFVNGVEKSTKTNTGKSLATGVSAFIVGGYPPNYFNGYIDELRIWKIARSAADITGTMKHTLMGNETGLTGYWKFDETTGTSAADSVTSAGHTAHPGVLKAASANQLPTWVAGAPLMCP